MNNNRFLIGCGITYLAYVVLENRARLDRVMIVQDRLIAGLEEVGVRVSAKI